MNTLIIIVGAFILLAGILILINPNNLFNTLRKHASKLWLHIFAVLTRLVVGTLLVYYASSSQFPFIIETIGWLAIIAGFFLLFVGRRIFVHIIYWALSLSPSLKRLAGAFAAFFGTLLIIAFA